VASSNGMDLTRTFLHVSSVGEVPFWFGIQSLIASEPPSLKASESDESLDGIGKPKVPTTSTLLDEFLSNLSCSVPHSLLDAAVHVQIGGASNRAERRSRRLDKKHKIPTPHLQTC
jgi:hypothetical protein